LLDDVIEIFDYVTT